MKRLPIPEEVVYEPGINALEALPVKKELETVHLQERRPYRSAVVMVIIPN